MAGYARPSIKSAVSIVSKNKAVIQRSVMQLPASTSYDSIPHKNFSHGTSGETHHLRGPHNITFLNLSLPSEISGMMGTKSANYFLFTCRLSYFVFVASCTGSFTAQPRRPQRLVGELGEAAILEWLLPAEKYLNMDPALFEDPQKM